MASAAWKIFSQRTSQIPRHLPVAVSVSGGSDSLALTILASKVFDKVLGLIVDHRLRENSTAEAQRASQLISQFGVEAVTLTLDWGEGDRPKGGKVQTEARKRRYAALLEECLGRGVRTLLLGHHLGDQHENFLHRFAMGSGIEGLGGMYPVTYWPGYPHTQIIRPFLTLNKCDLVEVCRCENVEWVEDPTNQITSYARNHYRKILAENPLVMEGVEHLTKTCCETRAIIASQVYSHTTQLTKVNTKHGYIQLDLPKLFSVPPPIAKRSLSVILRYIMGDPNYQFRYAKLESFYKRLSFYDNKTFSAGRTIISSVSKQAIGIFKTLYHEESMKKIPIKAGQTVLWEKKWEIKLKPKKKDQQCRDLRTYFIRGMIRDDFELAIRGIRRVRAKPLPPVPARNSLPVIMDDSGRVVMIPHFEFSERDLAVKATANYKPQYSLEDVLLLNYAE